MKSLMLILLLSLGLASAEGTATYDPDGNTYNPNVNPDAEFVVVKDMQNHWEKVAQNTDRDITYSYKIICNKNGECKAVDPPKFQR